MRTTTSWIASGALLALLMGLTACYPGIRTGATAPRAQAPQGGTSPPSIARPPTAPRRVVRTGPAEGRTSAPSPAGEATSGRASPAPTPSAPAVPAAPPVAARVDAGSASLPAGVRAAPARFRQPGFVVLEDDGRLWVFRERSEALAEFRKTGEPAKRVTKVGGGPDGRTLLGADGEVLDAYVAETRYGKPGYVVVLEDGRLWVFRAGSEALVEYRTSGEPAKRVTRIGAGPDGRTIMAPDNETLDGYLTAAGQGR